MGPTGSGKTSLLNSLCLQLPYSKKSEFSFNLYHNMNFIPHSDLNLYKNNLGILLNLNYIKRIY